MTGKRHGDRHVAAGAAHDTAGNPNVASTSTDNTVTYDITPPTVTIDQATDQTDPTNVSTDQLHRRVQRDGHGFATGDVTIGGTAGATTADRHARRQRWHDLQRGRQRHDGKAAR